MLYRSNLEKVFLPESVQQIGESAFYYCTSLTTIYLPKGLQYIDSSFSGCSSLSRIVIPNGVTFITQSGSSWTTEVNSFNHCSSLRLFYYKNKWTDNIVQNNTLISVAGATTALSISCNRIGNGAASACSISYLNMYCKEIGDRAFIACTNLTSLTIPAECTRIGAEAFYGCYGLNSITVNATTPPLGGSNMFWSTNNCPIYVPSASVSAYKEAMYWSDYANRIQAMP